MTVDIDAVIGVLLQNVPEREAAARNTEAHKRAIARAAGAQNGAPPKI